MGSDYNEWMKALSKYGIFSTYGGIANNFYKKDEYEYNDRYKDICDMLEKELEHEKTRASEKAHASEEVEETASEKKLKKAIAIMDEIYNVTREL